MESHRLLLSVVVFAVIVATLFLGKPSITGFIPTETYSQPIDLDVFESQRFVLSSESGEPLLLSSFSIAGSVSGAGLVNVYLTDGAKKWLVFSNRRKPGSSMEQITGLAVSELNIEPGDSLNRIETLPSGYQAFSGAFQNECLETCVLDEEMFNKPSLYLDVIIEPGTSLHISEVRYSTMGE
jgi:hypothetical protein